MKKIITLSLLLAALTAGAQETYENANIATQDLNGTARYVGMGGALDALGADISTISTNPAGIGLFRHGTGSVSFGIVGQQDAQKFGGADKTKASFDQAGFVIPMRTGERSFLNFGFNYHKSRNFNHILNAAGKLNGSQNRVTYNKLDPKGGNLPVDYGETFDENTKELTGWDIVSDDYRFSQVDYLYSNELLYSPDDGSIGYYDATGYQMDRANEGYIGAYDFNISGNINDRVYLGFTFGIEDVHYNGYSQYREALAPATGDAFDAILTDRRHITGTGFNVKFGAIFRPVEDDPFRFGISIATPTWYKLTTENSTTIGDNLGYTSAPMRESYEFKLYTPWRFGLSAGTTISDYLALGLGYEFADYGSLDSRVIDGYDYDGYEQSSSDVDMNDHTGRTLKGVSTLKLGAELKPDPNFAVRLGFNYVSPMYEKTGVKQGDLMSLGTYYQSATDYTNWEDTYRLTCGFGYRLDKFSFDLAYQYSQTNGTFTPFYDAYDGTNIAEAAKVSNKRHQLLFTMGYSF